MPNPKRKHTPSRRDSRRSSNSKLTAPGGSTCPQCGAAKMPHRVCPSCGFYNGELVMPRKEKQQKEAAEESK